MVPGMTGLIMGRGWKNAIFSRRLPGGLPFEIGAVTGRAMQAVESLAIDHIPVVQFVAGCGASHDNTGCDGKTAFHVTVTQVFIPAA